MELLRPSSDLARLAESFDDVDVLVAVEDARSGAASAVSRLAAAPDFDDLGELDVDDDVDDDDDDFDEVGRGVAELDLPQVHLHRLGLRSAYGPEVEADLVAAMSELVGFDPEPGTYCLAPASWPADPARDVVVAAARRIARVYGIPLLRYRCLELSVVPDAGS